jgi:hypothetical protein
MGRGADGTGCKAGGGTAGGIAAGGGTGEDDGHGDEGPVVLCRLCGELQGEPEADDINLTKK